MLSPLVTLVLLLGANALAAAQGTSTLCPVPKSFNNGCGSGGNERFVPDQLRVIGLNFSGACSKHDDCYSKCQPGGENFCKPVCLKQAEDQREGRRTTCDDAFYDDMKSTCGNAACRGMAFAYFVAVRIGGGGNFQGVEIPPEFYHFIQSESAKSFDFDRAAVDIEQLRKVPSIASNNSLVLSVKDNRLSPKLASTSIPTIADIYRRQQGVLTIDKLKYGDIDLSGAQYKGVPFKVDESILKALDPERLKKEQLYRLPAKP